MLKGITDYNALKKRFKIKFLNLLDDNQEFKIFLYELFINKGSAYVVGGYLRDIALECDPRDLDIMINIPQVELLNIINSTKLNYKINRLNGFKIKLNTFDVDLWSMEHNWAFENKLVIKNDDYLLNSIVNGCFYNFDSLAINIHDYNINVKNFNNLVNTNRLDIIQKNNKYQVLNPTIEANVLRAFYLKLKYNLDYSENCLNYLKSRIGFLEDKYVSSFTRLIDYKVKYPKYDMSLTEDNIEKLLKYIRLNSQGQTQIDFNDSL